MASEMEPKVRQTYLYDFYGELLNEHQQKIFEAFVFDDLSLGEIAEEQDISRQAVHDMIKRCNHILEGYEEKLHLVEKFLNIRRQVQKIHDLAGRYQDGEIAAISKEILEEL